MSTITSEPLTEDLPQDSVPDFSPLKEESKGLLERLKSQRKERPPRPPREPKEPSQPRQTAPRKVLGKGKTNHEKRANKVTRLVTTLGMGVGTVGLMRPHTHLETIDGQRVKVPDDLFARDAKAVMEGAALVGETWATWADENERVAAAIDSLSAGGAAAMALLSLLAIAVPVAANHGIVPGMLATQFTPSAIQKLIDEAKQEAEEAE